MRNRSAVLAFAVLGITACGDSTGPADLDTTSALHSLAFGMEHYSNFGIGFPITIDQSFDEIAPFVNKVTVRIGDSWQPMYALPFYQSFPPGTCVEDIFGRSPHNPSGCTPLGNLLAIMLWQSHSATTWPDRIWYFTGSAGVNCFDACGPGSGSISPFVEYVGDNEEWFSRSGTFTSSVSTATTPCSIPLPNYASSGECGIATFDLSGTITFMNFVDDKTLPMTISPQTIHGLSMTITEVRPCNC